MKGFAFHDRLMLRTPAYSFLNYDRGNLGVIIKEPLFQIAVFLANPKFFQLLELKEFDVDRLTEKEKLTLSKYYNQICFRPTPFGAFSGFAVVKWGRGETIGFGGTGLHLQLDQGVSLQFARHLVSSRDRDHLVLVNPTLYRVEKEYRFIKSVREEGHPAYSFVLESMNAGKLLTSLLALASRGNVKISDIVSAAVEKAECGREEAADYVEFLLNVQLSYW